MPVTPEDLAPGVESVESSGDPYAVSPKGAIGLYQIMPATARQYGYQPGDLYSTDVQKDIYNRHMGYLLNKYKGDPRKALAAWNAGEGNVDKGIMPAETRAYVPKVLSRLGGAVSGLMGEGTAEAAESKGPQKFQYSRSTGTFWTTGPDGNPVQVPTDQVPAGIRTKAQKLGPASPAAKLPTQVPTTPAGGTAPPGGENAEQWYERQFGKLGGLGAAAERAAPGTTGKVAGAVLGPVGKAAQYVLPGTIGEAAATGANLGALALAPETGGASLLLPIGAAMAGGYFEPSDQPWLSGQRFERAGIEGLKEAGGLVGAKALGKGLELGGRYAERVPMLKASAARIGRGVAALFSKYPGAAPESMEALRRDIADGRVRDAIGDNLGRLRKQLAQDIPEYVPGKAGKVAHGLEGLERYAAPTREQGVKFVLPDVDADGKLFNRFFSINDAVEHVERMNALSYSVAGQPKGGELSFAYRKAGHAGRDALEKQLNALGGQQFGNSQRLPVDIGTAYRKLSSDYGTAAELTRAFKRGNVGRTVTYRGKRIEVIDQPALKSVLDKDAMDHLSKLQGPVKKELFRRAVAPETGAAAEETGGHGTVTPDLLHTLLSFLGGPYSPEAREMLPAYARLYGARRGAVPVTRALATPLVAAPSQLAGGYMGVPPK